MGLGRGLRLLHDPRYHRRGDLLLRRVPRGVRQLLRDDRAGRLVGGLLPRGRDLLLGAHLQPLRQQVRLPRRDRRGHAAGQRLPAGERVGAQPGHALPDGGRRHRPGLRPRLPARHRQRDRVLRALPLAGYRHRRLRLGSRHRALRALHQLSDPLLRRLPPQHDAAVEHRAQLRGAGRAVPAAERAGAAGRAPLAAGPGRRRSGQPGEPGLRGRPAARVLRRRRDQPLGRVPARQRARHAQALRVPGRQQRGQPAAAALAALAAQRRGRGPGHGLGARCRAPRAALLAAARPALRRLLPVQLLHEHRLQRALRLPDPAGQHARHRQEDGQHAALDHRGGQHAGPRAAGLRVRQALGGPADRLQLLPDRLRRGHDALPPLPRLRHAGRVRRGLRLRRGRLREPDLRLPGGPGGPGPDDQRLRTGAAGAGRGLVPGAAHRRCAQGRQRPLRPRLLRGRRHDRRQRAHALRHPAHPEAQAAQGRAAVRAAGRGLLGAAARRLGSPVIRKLSAAVKAAPSAPCLRCAYLVGRTEPWRCSTLLAPSLALIFCTYGPRPILLKRFKKIFQ